MAGGTFVSGESVTLKDMPDGSGLNGLSATLVKTIGKDRWVVDIEGQEKTRIVTTANLEASGSAPTTSAQAYYIVGTWDEWEPHVMTFSKEDNSFGYEVQLGVAGGESFKLLLCGDWDRCVYPDRRDAAPHDGHALQGPDDGGLDTEWTISRHQEDSPDARYNIRLSLAPDGRPTLVDWQPLDRNEEQVQSQLQVRQSHGQQADPDTAPSRHRGTRPSRFGQMAASMGAEGAGSPEEEVSSMANAATRSRSTGGKRNAFTKAQSELTQKDAVLSHLSRASDSMPGLRDQLGGVLDNFGGLERARISEERVDSRLRRRDSPDDDQRNRRWEIALAGNDVVEVERQARLRLEKRLKDAAEAEILAIEDKRQRDEEDAAYEEWMGIKANTFKNLSRWKQLASEQQESNSKGRARSLGRSTPCVECGQPAVTCVMRDWVCKECHQAWVQAKEAGWDGRLDCGDGFYAAEWSKWLAEKEKMLPRDARKQVIERFPEVFSRRVGGDKAKKAVQAQAKGRSEAVGQE